MHIKDAIKRFSYNPLVGVIISRLGLRAFMQSCYARFQRDPAVLKFELNDVEGSFVARSPLELRIVEAAWYGEREMIASVQEALRTGDTFLDIGSNLGIYTVFAAKILGPRGLVIACEPETVAHSRLQRNIETNHLENVRLLKFALSDSRRTMKLVLADQGGVSQSAHLTETDEPSELVQTVSYDSLVADERFPIPQVVKMDIEGHEYVAIQGMRKVLSSPSCIAFFCEVHPYALPNDVSTGEIVKLIASLGFEDITARERGPQVHIVAKKSDQNR